MAKITLPTVHLNGTSAEELLGQVTQAAKKIHEAMAALANASPNGRDYYPQGDRAFTFADKEKETKKGPVPKKPSYETLKKALIDILDGSSQWYDIQYHTGLSNKRSEEISKLFNQLVGK